MSMVGDLSFYVAQGFRFAPFRDRWWVSRLLQPWCRFRPNPRGRAFYAGNGYRVSGATDNLFYISGLHELALLKKMHSLLRDGDTVWDIGANAGTSILWLHFARPHRQLAFVGFEAMASTAALLRENLSLNPNCRCQVFEAMVSDREGNEVFATAGFGDGSARPAGYFGNDEMKKRQCHTVQSTTIDLVLLQNTVQVGPKMMLVDVEGSAGGVFRGGVATLQRFRPWIALEIHSAEEQRQAEEVLFNLGYQVEYETRQYGFHRIYGMTGA